MSTPTWSQQQLRELFAKYRESGNLQAQLNATWSNSEYFRIEQLFEDFLAYCMDQWFQEVNPAIDEALAAWARGVGLSDTAARKFAQRAVPLLLAENRKEWPVKTTPS